MVKNWGVFKDSLVLSIYETGTSHLVSKVRRKYPVPSKHEVRLIEPGKLQFQYKFPVPSFHMMEYYQGI